MPSLPGKSHARQNSFVPSARIAVRFTTSKGMKIFTPISTHAPVLLPATALAAGTLFATHLTWLSVPLWAALGLLALTLRRPAGICLAFFAIGGMGLALRLGLPGPS